MEERVQHRLLQLIEEEVNSGHNRTSDKSLKELKSICRQSDEYVKEAFRLLWEHLSQEHAEMRWSAFLLIRELFDRSHCFRELLIENLNDYMVLVAETDRRKPLPKPKIVADRLKQASVALFKSWTDKFGSTYKKLDLAYRFLDDTKKIVHPASSASSFSDLFTPRTESRNSTIQQKKIDAIKSQILESEEELDNLMNETENLFRIVVPDILQDASPSVEQTNLRAHGLPSTASFSIQVDLIPRTLRMERTSETEALIEKMEENAVLLNGKCLPLTVHWLSVLSKSGAQQEDVKMCIDLKQRIEILLRKAATLGINFLNRSKRKKGDSDSEEEDFVDVPEGSFQETEMVNLDDELKPSTSGVNPVYQTSSSATLETVPKMKSVSTRDAHLSVAPVVPFGPDLERWGEPSDKLPELPANPKVDAVHRFWAAPDTEKDSPNLQVAESLLSRTMPFAGKFEPVKWFCRAPLPNGQLCPRQDRVKCPFHGKIIARDGTGTPSDEEERRKERLAKERAEAEKVPDWQEPEFLKDLEAATGKNLKVEKRKPRKQDNLTDLAAEDNTPKNRLAKKIFDRAAVKRVAATMDAVQRKNAAEKFQHNWNYASISHT
ncbi:UV-stimulated scaffold protein A-like [Paramacrobiotus metropolitanus]|uniref:UV-stimulated scaffold protein A-like n=1 Tax=Paramacrobiotus metropolitanus TaxID=2943436 RepID=UPI0024459D0A|nr:UV-stimulated scaffold protein A-like [Paramacrobiotus metropolitanus]